MSGSSVNRDELLKHRTNVAADSESRLANARRTFLAAELGVRFLAVKYGSMKNEKNEE